MRGTGGTWFNASKLLIQKDKCGTAFQTLMCPGRMCAYRTNILISRILLEMRMLISIIINKFNYIMYKLNKVYLILIKQISNEKTKYSVALCGN